MVLVDVLGLIVFLVLVEVLHLILVELGEEVLIIFMVVVLGNGDMNGGAGGYSNSNDSRNASGGVGNPTGSGAGASNRGTGGLLTLIVEEDSLIGICQSNGIKAGVGTYACGGSSGGGSINVFFRGNILNPIDMKNISVVGGAKSVARTPGGAGGTGTVTVGTIVGGYYTDLNI